MSSALLLIGVAHFAKWLDIKQILIFLSTPEQIDYVNEQLDFLTNFQNLTAHVTSTQDWANLCGNLRKKTITN